MAFLQPKGTDGNTKDSYSDQGFDFLELEALEEGRRNPALKALANRLLELGDMHLPGDEGLLLRAWIGGHKEIPLGDGQEPWRLPITLRELKKLFEQKELRNHNIHECLHNHIFPDLRRIVADDVETQRLITTVD